MQRFYPMNKSRRWLYFVLILLTIPAGIGTRNPYIALPALVRTYGGDVLAATCIYFGVRFWATAKPLWKVALIAYLICIAIETLQLYQAPWIVKVRHTYPFGILLGYGFLWSDWLCYAVGVVLGVLVSVVTERLLSRAIANK